MLRNIPNILTASRIIAVFMIIALWQMNNNFLNTTQIELISAIIFIIASISDYLDGYIARKYHLESKIGAALDPIADKLLVTSALLVLIYSDKAALLPTFIILFREILISGLREVLAEKKLLIPVTKLAKFKTAIQMLAITILLLGNNLPGNLNANISFEYFSLNIGNIMLWIAAIITIITAFSYCKYAFSHLCENQDKKNKAVGKQYN